MRRPLARRHELRQIHLSIVGHMEPRAIGEIDQPVLLDLVEPLERALARRFDRGQRRLEMPSEATAVAPPARQRAREVLERNRKRVVDGVATQELDSAAAPFTSTSATTGRWSEALRAAGVSCWRTSTTSALRV